MASTPILDANEALYRYVGERFESFSKEIVDMVDEYSKNWVTKDMIQEMQQENPQGLLCKSDIQKAIDGQQQIVRVQESLLQSINKSNQEYRELISFMKQDREGNLHPKIQIRDLRRSRHLSRQFRMKQCRYKKYHNQ